MVAPVSNKEIVLFLLIVTGKLTAYFVLLNLTSIILFSLDSHSESEEESSMLSELSESWCSLLISGSDCLSHGVLSYFEVLKGCYWMYVLN